MSKKLFLRSVIFAVALSFLVSCLPGPSVCDKKDAGPSLMCQAVEGKDYKLEDISFGIKIGSTGLMMAEVYTPEQLIKVLKEVRELVKNPITNLTFMIGFKEKAIEVPGLIELTSEFEVLFNNKQTMYARDREIITGYIDGRLAVLDRSIK